MEDREMLELAAKAAGMRIRFERATGICFVDCAPHGSGLVTGRSWNPLNDDGDRYRLARACELCVNFANKTVTAFRDGSQIALLYFGGASYRDGDEAECVVRAAAEIGRSKP